MSEMIEEIDDQFRRVLEIGIEEHDGISGGMLHTSRDRGLVTEVPRELNEHPLEIVANRQGADAAGGVVRAAVVDEDGFKLHIRQAGRDAAQPGPECREVFRFIENGNDERNKHESTKGARWSASRLRGSSVGFPGNIPEKRCILNAHVRAGPMGG